MGTNSSDRFVKNMMNYTLRFLHRGVNFLVLAASFFSNIVAIVAFFVAVIAFNNPNWVSNYLAKIEVNTREAVEKLESIENYAQRQSEGTEALVSSIPFWPSFEEDYSSSFQGVQDRDDGGNYVYAGKWRYILKFSIENHTNYRLDDLYFRVVDHSGKLVSRVDQRPEVLGPKKNPPWGLRAEWHVEISEIDDTEEISRNMPKYACITGTTSLNGETYTEFFEFEVRDISGRDARINIVSRELLAGGALRECLGG